MENHEESRLKEKASTEVRRHASIDAPWNLIALTVARVVRVETNYCDHVSRAHSPIVSQMGTRLTAPFIRAR